MFDLFSNDSAERARDAANAGARAGYDQLSGLYGQGRAALTSNVGQGIDLYKGLINSTGAGANAYGDASGANGVEGLQRADAVFKNSGLYGAYGTSLDQGLQALQRTHAAAGNLASGNADADTLKFATGLAGQTYSNYLQGLNPYIGANANAITGASNLYAGLGQGLNQSYQGQGGAANNMETTIGNNNAGAELNNYKVGANLWNGIMGVGNWLSGNGPANVAKGAQSLFSAFP